MDNEEILSLLNIKSNPVPKIGSRRKCLEEDCNNMPTFGTPETGALYCLRHRGLDHINIKGNKCVVCLQEVAAGRMQRAPNARYGSIGFRALHCRVHRLPGEENKYDRCCHFEGCHRIAYYGREGDRICDANSCRLHKLPWEVFNRKDKLCMVFGCTKMRAFGVEGGKSVHCRIHALSDEINLRLRK